MVTWTAGSQMRSRFKRANLSKKVSKVSIQNKESTKRIIISTNAVRSLMLSDNSHAKLFLSKLNQQRASHPYPSLKNSLYRKPPSYNKAITTQQKPRCFSVRLQTHLSRQTTNTFSRSSVIRANPQSTCKPLNTPPHRNSTQLLTVNLRCFLRRH